MSNSGMGLVVSIAFVFVVIFVSEILSKSGNMSVEATRKFIHIGVAHWWLVAMYLIDDIRYALIAPAIFVALNCYSYKKNLIKSMERGKNCSDLGTVYFPISLIIMILLTWNGGILGRDLVYLGAVSTLIMGYGDGFAAIVGKKIGKSKYCLLKNNKSLEGSIAMLLFSFTVSICVLSIHWGFSADILRISFILAVVATIVEAITPFGADNLTVPIAALFSGYYLLHIFQDSRTLLFIFMCCVGFCISFLIAFKAYKKRSLTLDGSIGATFMGTAIYATSGIFGSFLMIMFFFSSNFLSRFKKELKKRVVRQFDKTGRRDVFQVFANGGIGMIYSILFYITKNPAYLILLGIAFAAANADTWATELGILNKNKPISLRTLKRVEKGTSGAVSLLGTSAAFLGSMLIGVLAQVGFRLFNFPNMDINGWQGFAIITFGGFLGSVIDSLLGATLQGVYYSKEYGGETEKSMCDGRQNMLIRGFEFMNNDLVNFLSIGISSALFAKIL